MSLFDVIRYPISHPPTEAEIIAVPDDIFLKWLNEVVPNWKPARSLHAIKIRLGGAYTIPVNERDCKDLDALRRIIREYNESI